MRQFLDIVEERLGPLDVLSTTRASCTSACWPTRTTRARAVRSTLGASEAVRFELRGSGVDVSCVLPVVLPVVVRTRWLIPNQ
jgi:hypothetical protein